MHASQNVRSRSTCPLAIELKRLKWRTYKAISSNQATDSGELIFLVPLSLKVLGLAQNSVHAFKKYAAGFCFVQLKPVSRLKCTANQY